MTSQRYQRCFEKGKSQLGSENPYHISILLTFSPGLQVSESVYKSLTLFRHPSRRQQHKGSKISILHVEHFDRFRGFKKNAAPEKIDDLEFNLRPVAASY